MREPRFFVDDDLAGRFSGGRADRARPRFGSSRGHRAAAEGGRPDPGVRRPGRRVPREAGLRGPRGSARRAGRAGPRARRAGPADHPWPSASAAGNAWTSRCRRASSSASHGSCRCGRRAASSARPPASRRSGLRVGGASRKAPASNAGRSTVPALEPPRTLADWLDHRSCEGASIRLCSGEDRPGARRDPVPGTAGHPARRPGREGSSRTRRHRRTKPASRRRASAPGPCGPKPRRSRRSRPSSFSGATSVKRKTESSARCAATTRRVDADTASRATARPPEAPPTPKDRRTCQQSPDGGRLSMPSRASPESRVGRLVRIRRMVAPNTQGLEETLAWKTDLPSSSPSPVSPRC